MRIRSTVTRLNKSTSNDYREHYTIKGKNYMIHMWSSTYGILREIEGHYKKLMPGTISSLDRLGYWVVAITSCFA